jgi:DNA polymerase-3 subunit delta'
MGKKTLARAFAQTLQCENLQMAVRETGRPAADDPAWKRIDACGLCGSCKQAVSGNQADILTWPHEKPKLFSVDDARGLVEDIQIRPFSGRYKIYIVPDAQMMNDAEQNALLKTIEEPPSYVVILLLSENPDILLPTIRSRVVTLPLLPVRSMITAAVMKIEDSDETGQVARNAR